MIVSKPFMTKARTAGIAGVLALILLVGALLGADAYADDRASEGAGEITRGLSDNNSAQSALVLPGSEDSFVFKDCGGFLGIISSDGTSYITDISVAGLRAADRALLAEGIEVHGAAEYTRLMEDFGS